MLRDDDGVWKEPQQDDARLPRNLRLAAGRPQAPAAAQVAFDLDEELAVLEAQTKVTSAVAGPLAACGC